VQPEFARGLAEALGGIGVQLRGQRKVVATRRFEDVAVADHFVVDLVCLTRGAEHFLGEVEMRFEFFVADAVVLDRHPFGNEAFAVAFLIVAAYPQFVRHDAKMHARPMQPRAADALALQECGQLAIRQRGIVRRMTDRDRGLREIEKQLLADVVRQFVDRVRIGAVRIGVAVFAALECEDFQARFDEFLRENRASPAEADDHRVDVRFGLSGHQVRFP
jgi:hypothetical protein